MAIHRVDVGYCLGGSELDQLAGFTHPTMVANSAHDIMIATVSSQRLADHLPNGQLRLFPNAALGFPIQSPPSSRSSSRSRSEA